MNNTTIRKAAVLIESLDFPTRQTLLGQMDPRIANEVQSYAISMGRISSDERDAVMREFLTNAVADQSGGNPQHPLMTHTASPYSNQPDQTIASSIAGSTSRQASTAVPDPAIAWRFAFLQKLQPIEVALLLNQESTHVQAVVLSQLPKDFAATIIQSFAKQTQVDVIRRLATIQQVDDQAASIIADDLQTRCHGSSAAHLQAHPNAQPIQSPLRSAYSTVRSHLSNDHSINNQAVLDPSAKTNGVVDSRESKSASSEPGLTFGQLMKIGDSDFDTLLQSARPESTIVALRGADQKVVDRVLSRLPKSEAKEVQTLIKDLGPIKIAEIRDAQNYLVRLAEQLNRDGLMKLRSTRKQFSKAA